jgi:hypothetical protein
MSMRVYGLLAALAAVLLIGCGPKDETVVVGPDGSKMTSSKDGNQVKVTGPHGEMTADSDKGTFTMKDDKGNEVTTGGTVTEADLGVPFYPGSKEKPNANFLATENGKKSVVCTRTTSDAPDKVIEFYKDKVEQASTSSGAVGDMHSATLSGKVKGGEITVTAVKQGDADTDISIGFREK